MIGHEEGIKLAAFQGLDAVNQMLETEIRLRRRVRMAPPGGVDAHGAHEGAKMHLLHGGYSSTSPTIRASLPNSQRLNGFRHIMHAQNGGTPRRTRERHGKAAGKPRFGLLHPR